jgi:hypothetical protein
MPIAWAKPFLRYRLLLAVLKPQALTATTFSFNNLSLRFKVDGMKYLLCVLLLSISLVSNNAEATTCSINYKLSIDNKKYKNIVVYY